jgi:hypothetical protein
MEAISRLSGDVTGEVTDMSPESERLFTFKAENSSTCAAL